MKRKNTLHFDSSLQFIYVQIKIPSHFFSNGMKIG